jgi:hypothetical protein
LGWDIFMSMTREFLSKVLPWEQAGPGVFFNLHWKAPLSNPRPGFTHYWDGRAYSTLDELVHGVEFFGVKPNIDAYVCMSSQSRYEEKTSKANKPYKKAVRFTTNVVGLKSFYIDIDVKEKAYATQKNALEAFRLFLVASDMPMPTVVVASGSGGFHAHWVVERPLSLDEWQPIANALAHACIHFELIVDTQCTVDSARILRIPGTFNQKSNPPNPVAMISSGANVEFNDLKETLAPFIGLTPVGNTSEVVAFPFERRQAITEVSELSEGIELNEIKPKITDVAEACPFIADAICDGGANYNNPLWYMTLQVAAFVEEGRDAAHLMSFQHPTYSEEETDAEYDRVVRQHKEKDIGWPKCDKINLSGATQCAGCPLLQSHKSPLNYVLHQVQTPPAVSGAAVGTSIVDIWPDRYSHRPDGFIYISITGEDGAVTETKVCPYPIMHGWLQDNPWTLHFSALTSTGRVTNIEVPFEAIGAMGGARKVLGAQGMVLTVNAFKATEEFLMAWIQKLQQHKDAVVSSTPFGWALREDKTMEGFTYAGRVWGSGTDRPAAMNDREMGDIYSPQGQAQPWIDAAAIIVNQDRPALNALLAGSFAAPLVRLTGHEGMQIAGWSKESGIGKTTAMNVATAVWGDSIRAKQGLDDTSNSVFGRMGTLKHLPIFWDEIQTDKQKENFAKNQFQLTSGAEKSRMNKDLTQRKRGTWQTMMIAASNFTLIEAVMQENKSHTAGLMRLFEFKIAAAPKTAKGQIEPGVASRAIAHISDHYGHAGLVYSQFLGSQHDRIKQEVGHLQDAFNKKYNADREERFWIGAMVTLVAGAGYANELGLTKINLTGLEAFLAQTLEEMRDVVRGAPVDMANQVNVSNILAQYLNAMRVKNTLITNRILVGAGKPKPGSIKTEGDVTKLDGVYIHIGRDDRLLRISATHVSRWLGEQKLPRMAFLKALEAEFSFREVVGILGGGTLYSAGAKERLYEVNMDNPKLVSFLE